MHELNKQEKYKLVFESAREFINEIIASHPEWDGVTLEKLTRQKVKFDNLSDANRRLIQSLTNRNRMSNVIGISDRNKEKIEKILFGFDPKKILSTYQDEDKLLKIFKERIGFEKRKNKRGLWYQFARGILSGSRFITSFKNKDEFDRFIKTFALNKYTRASLPMLLKGEIKGFGFALACDFIKELGYREYPKPDIHLIKIFYGLGLSDSDDQYTVYKNIIEMAEVVQEDAYTVDKMFWLIGSGKFVDNKSIGQNRDKFIKKTKSKMVRNQT